MANAEGKLSQNRASWRCRSWAFGLCLPLLVGGLSACGGGRPAQAPVPAPQLAGDYLPPGLDLVLRIDLSRLRDYLRAQDPAFALGELLAESVDAGWFQQALLRTKVAHLGLRLGEGGPDGVLVLEGNFEDISEAELAQSLPEREPLASGLVRRAASDEHRRRAAAVLYSRGNELWVLGTPAERDALDRRLERGEGRPSLIPEARGVLSFALRLGAEQDASSGSKLWQLLADCLQAEGLLVPSDAGLKLELRLDFRTEKAASRARAALELLAQVYPSGGYYRKEGSRLELQGKRLSLDLELGPQIAELWEQPRKSRP